MTVSRRWTAALALCMFVSSRPAAGQQAETPSRYGTPLETAPEPGARGRPAAGDERYSGDNRTDAAVPAANARQAEGNPQPNAGQFQPAAPFQLSPQQQQFVDELLAAWEKHSSGIKTFECEFTRWEYRPNPVVPAAAQQKAAIISSGELKFLKPDRGLFHVAETQVFNAQTAKFQKAGEEMNEHWVCDGKTVWEVDHAAKQVKENLIPDEMQGKQIGDGPLPFMLFGGEAAKLKARYFLRERTDPQAAAEEIWLEAYPRWRNDAANFRCAQIIMKRADFLPYALRLYSPNGTDYTVFEFRGIRLNNPFFSERKLSQPSVPRGFQLVRAQQAAAISPALPPRR